MATPPDLSATTTSPDGRGCRPTEFSEALRKHETVPELSGPEWEAVRRYLSAAVNALMTEALARSRTAREDSRRERRSNCEPGLPRTPNPDSATDNAAAVIRANW